MKCKALALVLVMLQLAAMMTGCFDFTVSEPSLQNAKTDPYATPKPRLTPAPLPLSDFAAMTEKERKANMITNLRKLSEDDCDKITEALFEIQNDMADAYSEEARAMREALGEPAIEDNPAPEAKVASQLYEMTDKDALLIAETLLKDEEISDALKRLGAAVFAQHIMQQITWDEVFTPYVDGDFPAAKAAFSRAMDALHVTNTPGGAQAILDYAMHFKTVTPLIIPWLMETGQAEMVTDDVLLAAIGALHTERSADVIASLLDLVALLDAGEEEGAALAKRAMSAMNSYGLLNETARQQLAEMNYFWRLQYEKPALYGYLKTVPGYDFLPEYEAVPQRLREALGAEGEYALNLYWTQHLLELYGGAGDFVPENAKPGKYTLVADPQNQYYGKKDEEMNSGDREKQFTELQSFLSGRPSYALEYTGDPNEASIIITYKFSFPFYSRYTINTKPKTSLSVYSFAIELIAKDALTGKTLAKYSAKAKPPRTISISPSTYEFYYDLSNVEAVKKNMDNADAFVKKLLPKA